MCTDKLRPLPTSAHTGLPSVTWPRAGCPGELQCLSPVPLVSAFYLFLRKKKGKGRSQRAAWGLAGLAEVWCITEPVEKALGKSSFPGGTRQLRERCRGVAHPASWRWEGIKGDESRRGVFPSLSLQYSPSNLNSVSLWKSQLQLAPVDLILHNQTDLKIWSLLPWAFGAGLTEGNRVIAELLVAQTELVVHLTF